jgi:hypothetical protein
LADLLHLRFAAITLQVDTLFNTFLSEDMVTAFNPFFESQIQQQLAKAVELDIRI